MFWSYNTPNGELVNLAERRAERDTERRIRELDHIMRCTLVGCTRCNPPDFELRRVARQARSVA